MFFSVEKLFILNRSNTPTSGAGKTCSQWLVCPLCFCVISVFVIFLLPSSIVGDVGHYIGIELHQQSRTLEHTK